ncbi:MAG: zinc ribbon domain-containing protein [Nanobdellota archaeon]
MAEIPGKVFVIIGLIVTVSSYFLNNMRETSFLIFIIIGALMFIYGLFKLFMRKDKDETGSTGHKRPAGQGNRSVSQAYQHPHEHHRTEHDKVMNFCPGCGHKVPPGSRFCPSCGIRLA